MNTRNLTRGLLAVAVLSILAGAALASGDPSHFFSIDWHALGAGTLLLANGAMPIADQITNFEAKRKSAQESAAAIVQKSLDEGRTLDEHETEQHKGFVAEVKAIDDHIVILRDHEKLMLSKAPRLDVEVVGRDNPAGGAGGRGAITVRSNLPPGIRFTRFALAMAHAKGNVMHAHEIAKVQYKDTPEVVNALHAAISMGGTRDLVEKAAVAIGLTSDSAWAGPLVQYNDMASEFVGLLRPKMILGRMTSVRRVPFMMRTVRQLTGVTGAFVGESLPKPVGRQTYDNPTLGFAKAAVIVVMSDELVRFSNPQAEVLARDDMVAGIATYLDKRFIDPSYSGVANVSPASITNGATRVQSSGSTLAAIDTDVRAAMAPFTASDVDPATAVWVMSPATALALSMKRTATSDQLAFPKLTMEGGEWYGLPVIVSSASVTSGSPSESGKQIALVTQSEVFLADDGGISIDMSMEASVQMNDAPSAGAQSLVSLWQNNLLGIRAERYINWAPRRPNNLGIVLIENTNY